MKRKITHLAHVFLALSLLPLSCQSKDDRRIGGPGTTVNEKQASSGSQSLSQPDFDSSREVKAARTIVPGELLLRMLQFDAPYKGYFQELRLYREGTAITFRNVPNWALQNSQSGRLGENALAEVGRSLAEADLSRYSASSMPEPAGLHTVLIFFDGRAYQRRNLNGPLPTSIQAPIDVVQDVIKAAPNSFEEHRKSNDAAREAGRILREGSGWNVPKELQLVPLKGVQGLLLTVNGVRGDAKTSVYHVLLFFPEGRLSYQPVDPANWPNNPRAEVRLTFEHPNEPSGIGIKTVTHELVIVYRVIENTLNVDSHSFPLSNGNLFVIQLDKNWTPKVRAFHSYVAGPSLAPVILDEFKAQLRTDRLIQSLTLGG